ncbi:MAG: hypothetical protein Q9191_000762 [Dirinaria sp. TL-2023a]
MQNQFNGFYDEKYLTTTPRPNAGSFILNPAFNNTSPSLYLNFDWVGVTDSCGLLGVSSSKLIAFHTDELSTYDGYYYNEIGDEIPLQFPLPQSFNLRDLPCPPPAVMSKNWYTPAAGEPYIPYIALPPKLSHLDPRWAGCGMALDLTAFDPPRALTPVAGMAPVTTKNSTPSGKPAPNPEKSPPMSGSIASSESPPSPAATPKLNQPEKTRELTSTTFSFGPKSSGHSLRPELDGPDTKESPHPPASYIRQHATEDPVANMLPSAVFGSKMRSTKEDPSRPASQPKAKTMRDPQIKAKPSITESLINRPGPIGLDSKVSLQSGSETQRRPSQSPAPKPLPSIIAGPKLPASTYKSVKPVSPTLSADPQVPSRSSIGNGPTSQGSASHLVDVPHDSKSTYAYENSVFPLGPSIVVDGGTTIATPFDGSGGLYVAQGSTSAPEPRVTSTEKDEEASSVSSLHLYHLTSKSKMPITVGTKIMTPISKGFVFHGSSIIQGKDPVTVAGTRISMDDAGHIVIGVNTYELPSPQTTKVLATALPDGVSIHALSSGRYVYQGATLTPGSPAAIVSGITVSLDSSHNIFIPELSHSRQGASHATTLLATVAGASITLLPSALEAAGTTLSPGDPAITLSGTPIVFHHTALIVGSHTLSLPTIGAQQMSATIAGEAITAEHGRIVVSGTTFHPGKSGVTLNNITIYINSKGHPVVGTKTDGDPSLASLIIGGSKGDSSPATASDNLKQLLLESRHYTSALIPKINQQDNGNIRSLYVNTDSHNFTEARCKSAFCGIQQKLFLTTGSRTISALYIFLYSLVSVNNGKADASEGWRRQAPILVDILPAKRFASTLETHKKPTIAVSTPQPTALLAKLTTLAPAIWLSTCVGNTLAKVLAALVHATMVSTKYESGARHARRHAEDAWDAARTARERVERLRRALYEDDELYRQRRGPETESKGERDALKEARERAEKLRRELRDEATDRTGGVRWNKNKGYAERRPGATGKNPGERPRRTTHEKPQASDHGNTRKAPKQEPKQEIPPPPDHYAILGISPTATNAEILKAAKKKRIEAHPDRFVGQNLAPLDEAKMIELSKNVGLAADTLSDSREREKYDREVARWKARQKPENAAPTANKTANHKPTRAYSAYRDTKTFYQSESEEDLEDSTTDESDDSGKKTQHKTDRPGASTQKPKSKPKSDGPRRAEGYRERPRDGVATDSRSPDPPDVVKEDVPDVDCLNREKHSDGIFGPQPGNSSDEDILDGPE